MIIFDPLKWGLQDLRNPVVSEDAVVQDNSPAFNLAKKAAEEKRTAVLAAVAASHKNESCRTVVKVIDKVADYPSEHSHEGMNTVAHRLAINDGSQCGYCSVGFVMNMSEFIINNPKADSIQPNSCKKIVPNGNQ